MEFKRIKKIQNNCFNVNSLIINIKLKQKRLNNFKNTQRTQKNCSLIHTGGAKGCMSKGNLPPSPSLGLSLHISNLSLQGTEILEPPMDMYLVIKVSLNRTAIKLFKNLCIRPHS